MEIIKIIDLQASSDHPKNNPYKPPYTLNTWRGAKLEVLGEAQLRAALQECWEMLQITVKENTMLMGPRPPKTHWWQRLF